ncbi:MAG: hypothetical protein LBG96_08330 [Tannerella sp.]|nr:hypothetical protein [Tannerella sp.]
MFISEYEINACCGLSCYIPHPNTYYKTLKWYVAAGIGKLNTGQDNVSEILSPETVLPP